MNLDRDSATYLDSTIYLDAQATTPCDPEVVRAMAPCWTEDFGNPASAQHAFGCRAADRVEKARTQVSTFLGCEPREVVFTSGATEADNLALLGVVGASSQESIHVITCATEHKAILDTCARLEQRGVSMTYLPVQSDGRIDPEQVERVLRPETVLVSLMLANNEIGVLQPVIEVAALCRSRGVLTHTDAAQGGALLDCRVDRLGVDLLSLSAHKMYGPKGVGALYVRRRRPRVRLEPQSHGGGHEQGRRSGTLAVPALVGFGRACELAAERREKDGPRQGVLRDRLLHRLRDALPDLIVNGSLEHRLSNNLNISLPGVEARALLQEVHGVALASGSACTSSATDGSYVVRLLPGGAERAEGALRFGLLRTVTEDEVDRAAHEVVQAARRVRRAPRPLEDPCFVGCEV